MKFLVASDVIVGIFLHLKILFNAIAWINPAPYLSWKNAILPLLLLLAIHAPEGTTELFNTKYFDEEAYLSQSGQLYLEATAMAFGKVFSFGPTFRAEKSKTRRHLIEFWMIEAEMAFCNHDESLALQEAFVNHLLTDVLENVKNNLKFLVVI